MSDWLSSGDALALLAVKPATLYAYVSRGLVRSVRGPHGRPRRYAREDVARLVARRDARAGHGVVAAAALRWGEPVLDTALSDVTPEGPRYRGVPLARLLVEAPSFEVVFGWLATGSPASSGPFEAPDPRVAARRAELVLDRDLRCSPIAAMASVAGLVAAATEGVEDDPTARRRRITRLVVELARVGGAAVARTGSRRRVSGPSRLGRQGASIAAELVHAFGAEPTGEVVHAVDRALLVCADHELNASTFTARIAASTGASLEACVAAALHTLTGPRHGGMGARVEALVDEAERRGPMAALRARLARGEAIPGFGHPLYPHGDPRGTALLALAASFPRTPRGRTVMGLVRAMERLGQPRPTLDGGLVALASALALPRGAGEAIFALGRCAGWVAHAEEERARGVVLRPRARYVGA